MQTLPLMHSTGKSHGNRVISELSLQDKIITITVVIIIDTVSISSCGLICQQIMQQTAGQCLLYNILSIRQIYQTAER